MFSGPWFLGEISDDIDYALAPLPTLDEAGGEDRELSTREFKLLRHLIQNRGRVLSRDQLMQGLRGHALEAVDAERGDGSEDRALLAAGVDEEMRVVLVAEPRRALVEIGQAAAQVGRITAFARKLAQASRDLPQGLGPAAGGVGQHHHVLALVAVVFGDGDADIDRRLTGHHRHVGGVGHQQGALHQGSVGMRVLELGKAVEHVHQLVAPFAAADEDHDVGVGPAGHLVLDHGLAGTEGAGHRPLAAFEQGEKGVEDALPGDQRLDAVVPAVDTVTELLLDIAAGGGATAGRTAPRRQRAQAERPPHIGLAGEVTNMFDQQR